MQHRTRREFLAEVGRGMLVASVGAAAAAGLDLAPAAAEDAPERLTFGRQEPLVALMQETPADRLLPLLVDHLRDGVSLRQLVAAGALANARKFGGQDYDGYHAFMALRPAWEMAREIDGPAQAVPVLKVLYRNTANIQQRGGTNPEALHPVAPEPLADREGGGAQLREAMHQRDMDRAERTFAALCRARPDAAFDDLQLLVQDHMNVHRVVLAWRAWALLDLAGQEQAHTLLRQSVRYCVQEERDERVPKSGIRTTLPRLLDQHHLVGRQPGTRRPDDAWLDGLCLAVYSGTPDQAADAVAVALAEGIAPEAIAEAISLAANQQVLRDPGRKKAEPGKPVGSVHGASQGVHASDAANAWRNIARVSSARNTFASLVCAGYHTAASGGLNRDPYPTTAQLAEVRAGDPAALLRETDAAIRANDQFRACALVTRYGELGASPRPVFELLRRYATSEDGALHAEKYYRTVVEEFAASRPAFRWRHLAALARVTASEHGFPAPGYEEARRLLKG